MSGFGCLSPLIGAKKAVGFNRVSDKRCFVTTQFSQTSLAGSSNPRPHARLLSTVAHVAELSVCGQEEYESNLEQPMPQAEPGGRISPRVWRIVRSAGVAEGGTCPVEFALRPKGIKLGDVGLRGGQLQGPLSGRNCLGQPPSLSIGSRQCAENRTDSSLRKAAQPPAPVQQPGLRCEPRPVETSPAPRPGC